ncbi:hypothetical protein KEM48_007720 [Puccinia striiformis f. sp. tritici PST-130]|uniref:Dihydrofolate synthetase n=1 Tax=Puccinia striiformis f. sp. tritici PST-78 TaxID=1165861 RepID=A0A0L0V6H1_9BASI|nr:hypothetical protein Pst134EB_010774 [Puccinia striiformis f. sp. tritici]KAI9611984.1 hypothetical protein H4Q26_008074 [Puccinia striiformis f. sp. tritici PST-130]KAI9621485.1 hypothetical protein KEM48_007720 [Puccinia striiformis f. sp. tritici PST-130]KNE94868.1 hypothetical protein PSTG_11772 [Puccinia striiformis f. sp. tritici PST-78]
MTGGTIKLGLERIQQVLKCLSNPHLKIPIIHVAGTNGKGSVCAYESEILRRSGLKVGRFTSPFLIDPTDSINLNGDNIDRETFEETKTEINKIAQSNQLELTSFELLTAIAFEIFAKPRFELDLAVIEVGLGGERDSTNVCETGNTLASCITPISIDHQAFLGSTVSEIAFQKAGIAKPNVPILLAQQSFPEVRDIVRTRASAESCDLLEVRPYPVPQSSIEPLPPLPLTPWDGQLSVSSSSPKTVPNLLSWSAGFQHQNAATAATLAHLLRTHHHPLKLLPSLSEKITDQAIIEGIKNTRWQGRLELAEYKGSQLLLDGAHNGASAKLLGDHINSLDRPITLIIALSSPRDPGELIEALDLGRLSWPPQIITTNFSIPEDMAWVRPVSPDLIASHIRPHTTQSTADSPVIKVTSTPLEALNHAISIPRTPDELIVICGSLYLISDVLRIIDNKEHMSHVE